MQRYIVNEKLELDKKDIKHIVSVMRMKINDKFQMVNSNIIYTCKINNIESNKVEYEIMDTKNVENNKHYKVVIACSVIKEQKMDYLLQKATELGVDEIIPLITERTVVKIDKKDNKIIRWNRIVKEASEQSHRSDVPIINDFSDLKKLINYDADIKILCNTEEMSKNIKKMLQDIKKRGTILVVVGPEGGFSSNEVAYLNENGFTSVTLGNNILRAETVPLYILSIINYEFIGDEYV